MKAEGSIIIAEPEDPHPYDVAIAGGFCEAHQAQRLENAAIFSIPLSPDVLEKHVQRKVEWWHLDEFFDDRPGYYYPNGAPSDYYGTQVKVAFEFPCALDSVDGWEQLIGAQCWVQKRDVGLWGRWLVIPATFPHQARIMLVRAYYAVQAQIVLLSPQYCETTWQIEFPDRVVQSWQRFHCVPLGWPPEDTSLEYRGAPPPCLEIEINTIISGQFANTGWVYFVYTDGQLEILDCSDTPGRHSVASHVVARVVGATWVVQRGRYLGQLYHFCDRAIVWGSPPQHWRAFRRLMVPEFLR